MSDERKVHIEVDGIVYRGRRSVHKAGNRVWIDGQEVGVEIDNNGDPLATTLPIVEMDGIQKKPWWQRLRGLLRRRGLLGWRSK
jgi:hypothetical protein